MDNAQNGQIQRVEQAASVQRLEVLPANLQTSSTKTMSPERVKAILEERARALARVDEVESGEMLQLVVFCLANERYGIATEYVRDVQPITDLSPVPCTPGFVVGIVNIRGKIYSVIDIRQFFGVPKREITSATKVIVVDAAELEVGILADDVEGAENVPLSEIKTSLGGHAGIKEEHVEGVTEDMLIILNLEALLSDEQIVVNEEVA